MNLVTLAKDLIKSKINDTSIPADIRDTLEKVLSEVKFEASKRLTRAAGSCHWIRQNISSIGHVVISDIVIKLSIPLLERGGYEITVNTILHEVAHAVQVIQQKTSDHGPRWQHIHKALGGTAERLHNIDREGLHRTITRYEYRDLHTDRVVTFTKANHQKVMLYGSYRYRYIATLKIKGKNVVRLPTEYSDSNTKKVANNSK